MTLKKSVSNKKKHGIDFEGAKDLWKDRFAVAVPARFKCEERFAIIGNISGTMWTAIFTMRHGVIRIISCRHSRKSEVNFYGQAK